MDIVNQEMFGPAKTKTDWFFKIFITIIAVVIAIVVISAATNQILLANPTLDPLTQSLLALFSLIVAVLIIFVIWKSDILYDNRGVF